MTDHDGHELWNTRQVAKVFNVKPATVNRWVREGKLTPAYSGAGPRGERIYTRGAVEAFMDRHHPTQEAD